MKSRILLGILAFCMVVGMVSFTAFASTDMSASDFSVTGDAGSYRWNSTDEVLTITGSGELSIANIDPTTPTTNSIVVQNGVTANLTLNGVNIDVSSVTNACAFDIQGTATANITLQGTNKLESGANKAGLQVQSGATLHILADSTGSLNATGGNGGAGIGGGNITISGGTVVAEGNNGGAGIGGTFKTQADGSTPGNAFIIASSISDNADTSNWSGVIFGGDSNNPDHGYFYGTNAVFTLLGNAEVPQGKTLVIPSGKTFSISAAATLTNNGTIYAIGDLNADSSSTFTDNGTTLPQNNSVSPTFDISMTNLYFKDDGAGKQYSFDGTNWNSYTGTATLFGTTTENSVQVQSGEHDIILNHLNIDRDGGLGRPAFDIDGFATANITLQGTNTLQGSSGAAGLQVEGAATLNITSASSGSLFAVGGGRSAGIGGSGETAGGIITISGGTVTATGGLSAAGIGGGSIGAGGTVKITGGTVTATGGKSASEGILGGRGIGSGQGNGIDDGILEISGGTVTATGGSGAPAFSVKPIISLQENQMAKAEIMAGDASPGTAVFQSTDYHTNVYVKLAVLDVQQASITLDNTLTYYNGTPQTQSVQVAFGGSALVADTDYTVSGNTATNAGDHTLTITGNGNYIGTITRNYTIERATLTITGATAQSKVYDGITDATADVSFGGLANGETLVKDIDYTVSADFPSPNVGDNLTVGGVVQLTNTALASNYIFSNAEFSFPTTASITPLPSVTPETGDDFNPVLWISIAIISLGGALVFIRKKLAK